MNRLGQAGIFIVALGVVSLFMGIFPFSVNPNATPGIGIIQIAAMLAGLSLVVVGGYIVVYASVLRNRPGNMIRSVGVRLGMTGMVFSAAAALADVMGFGSHTATSMIFGPLQGAGMLAGFLMAMIGVLIYGLSAIR